MVILIPLFLMLMTAIGVGAVCTENWLFDAFPPVVAAICSMGLVGFGVAALVGLPGGES